MIARRWEGQRSTAIAAALNGHPHTVHARSIRFTAEGSDGLADRPGAGGTRRIREAERRVVIALVASAPPGRRVRQRDGALATQTKRKPAPWTREALTATAQERGITLSRRQVRRILLAEGGRWCRTDSWAESDAPAVAPKRRRSSAAAPIRQQVRPPAAGTNAAR